MIDATAIAPISARSATATIADGQPGPVLLSIAPPPSRSITKTRHILPRIDVCRQSVPERFGTAHLADDDAVGTHHQHEPSESRVQIGRYGASRVLRVVMKFLFDSNQEGATWTVA